MSATEIRDIAEKERAISQALTAALNRRICFAQFVRIVARLDEDGKIEGLSVEQVINKILAVRQ